MNRKKMLLTAIATLAMVMSGCSAAAKDSIPEEEKEPVQETILPQGEPVHVDASYDGGEVEITLDNLLIVTLESNPTTGFGWELAKMETQLMEPLPQKEPQPGEKDAEPTEPLAVADPHEGSVLEMIEHHFVDAEDAGDKEPMVGTGGEEVWTFAPFHKGESTIYMEYSRPWEGGEKAVKTFVLTVVVK